MCLQCELQLDLSEITSTGFTQTSDEMRTFGENQAVNEDYTNSGFTRGHVFPQCQSCDQDQAESTFTLTNVAPQKEADNKLWAKEVENPLKSKIEKECKWDKDNKVYVVTGVVPGKEFIQRRIGNVQVNRVNIPTHYWSAFACKRKKQNKPTDVECMLGGYMLEMKGDKGTAKATVYENIQDLNAELEKYYPKPFKVFGEKPEPSTLRKLAIWCGLI